MRRYLSIRVLSQPATKRPQSRRCLRRRTLIPTIQQVSDRSPTYTLFQKCLKDCFCRESSLHVESSQNFNRFQSAYRRGFSTETAILRMLNDVYSAADDRRRSMIVLLDLSAAFDTIDISTLLFHLQHTFGISGLALLWLKTYLEGRTQYVRVGSDRSSAVSCEFGVPQGSVLGPMLCRHLHCTNRRCHIIIRDPSHPICGRYTALRRAEGQRYYIEAERMLPLRPTAGSRRMVSPSIQINQRSS